MRSFFFIVKVGLIALALPGLSAAWAGGEMTLNTSPKVAAYFEKAKANESVLIAFLHQMPKGGDLHNHLYGAVEAEDILAQAQARGLYFDRQDKSFVAAKPSGPHYGPEEMTANFWQRAEILEAISMRNLALSGESGHGHFFRSFYRFIRGLPSDPEMLREVFQRAVHQRLSYLEIMTYPVSAAQVAEVEAVKGQVLSEFAADGLAWELELRYIYPLDRNSEPASFREQLAEGVKAWDDPALKTVAITMLSPEDDHISQRDFEAQMAAIDELWQDRARKHRQEPASNPPPPLFTLHSGELTLEYAAYRTMLDRLSRTIELGHASRIGHGVSISWENEVYGLLKKMRDQKVAVEICLTSNEGILKVAGGDRHPFRLYWEAGVPVVLATDDEGLSRSNLTVEFAKAAQWFDLSYGELKWLAFSSLEYSFLPGDSLFREGDFNALQDGWEALVESSEKAQRQKFLLEALADFERRLELVIDDFGW